MEPSPDHPDAALTEAEALISRIVDGEATAADYARLRALARAQPQAVDALLAELHRAASLAAAVEPLLARTDAVELPGEVVAASRRSRVFAAVGWAAVLLAATAVVIIALGRRSDPTAVQQIMLSPEEHFDRYADAPYVLMELDPVLLETQPLGDGRTAVRYLRRLEEVLIIDGPPPLDEEGAFTEHPKHLRRRQEPAPDLPN